MGVHTGDSVTVAPQQTLTDRTYQRAARPGDRGHPRGRRRDRRLQRAVRGQPRDRRDPRHRDEPARVALERAGLEGHRASRSRRSPPGWRSATRSRRSPTTSPALTPASFEPTIDYVVVKWPRFAFEKFPGVDERADDAHEVGGGGDGDRPDLPAGLRQGACARASSTPPPARGSTATLLARLERPDAWRYDVLLEALRRGVEHRRAARAHADRPVVPARAGRAGRSTPRPPFAGERSFKSVDTCAAEFPAATPYYYSGWERRADHEVRRGDAPSVVILGSGPNRIGQGIEFDYCCVHAAMTVREQGRDAVMVNCNPETVSTDYDTSDRLYFEPLTLEDVLAVVEVEKPEGVIVQFGGQTPLRLAAGLQEAGVPLLGTSVEAIDLAEDRGRFGALLDDLGYRAPPYAHLHVGPRRVGARARGRVPAARAPVLRARRPGDGDRLRRRGAARLPRARIGTRRRPRPRDLPRPLPRGRRRGRRRRPVRRRGRVDRRDHAARRGGRRALGRLGLRAAAALARARDARRHPRADARHRPRPSASSACSTSSSPSTAASST